MTRVALVLCALLASCEPADAPVRQQDDVAAPAPAATSAAEPPANAIAAVPKAPATAPPPAEASVHPCLVDRGRRLTEPAMRALGTEPFWNARIHGRCVTYSTPEDQKGTRIWTRFEPRANGGTWSGAFNGKPFRLSIEQRPNCSDGMSDRRYDYSARLTVGGEERTGCAEVVPTGR